MSSPAPCDLEMCTASAYRCRVLVFVVWTALTAPGADAEYSSYRCQCAKRPKLWSSYFALDIDGIAT